MDVEQRLVEAQRALSSAILPSEKLPLGERSQFLTRRLAKINTINITGGECQVQISSSALDGVRWYQSYFPRVGDLVWVEFNGGTDPIIIGTQNAATPAVAGVQDPWHIVGAAGEPAFQNGWVWYGAGWSVPAFRRVGEIVYVKGAVKSGTVATNIFQLPSGFRPKENSYYAITASPPVTAGALNGTLLVDSSGQLNAYNGGNTYFAVECSFVAEQ